MIQKFSAEILFILGTLTIAVLFLLPIYQEFGGNYEFYWSNFSFIFIFLMLSRYLFLLKYTPFSHVKWLKVVFIFACIPMFLYLIDGFYNFQRFLDEIGLQEILLDKSSDSAYAVCKYTRTQYLFFAVGGLITMVLFPIRMIVSLWRQANKDTV